MNRLTQIFVIIVLFFLIGIIVGNYKIYSFSIIKKIYRSTLYNINYDSSDLNKKRWRGPWDSDINYIENDCVYYEGNSFLTKKDNINQAPILNSTYWDTTTIYGRWSIGIFQGESVFNLSDPLNITNPIISASDVTDCDALFVADPFLYFSDSTFYLFFEILNKSSNQGDIGYAISQDLIKWSYEKIVLDEEYHLSYPYIFSWDNNIYMIPESHRDLSVRLYRATLFPETWEFLGNLLSGFEFADPSIFRYNNKWWMFVYTRTKNFNTLNLFYSDTLIKGWTPHPKNPIIRNDLSRSRPGGRVLNINGEIYRLSQNGIPSYGTDVNAFKIIELNIDNYIEEKAINNPIVKQGNSNWNSFGMHHVDAHLINGKWVAAVDGRNN